MPTKVTPVTYRWKYVRITSLNEFIVSTDALDYVNTRTGTSLPGWRKIIKSGGSATTAMTGTKYRILEGKPFNITCGHTFTPPLPGFTDFREDVGGTDRYYVTFPGHLTGTSLTKADNLALTKAFGRVKDQRNQFQGLVALGELRETIQFMRSPFKGVVKYVQTYLSQAAKVKRSDRGWKSRGFGGASRKSRQTVADAWLENAFALQPLLNDTKAAAESIARFQNDSRRSMVSSYGEDQKSSDGFERGGFGSMTSYQRTWRDVTTQSVRYKVAMDYKKSADFGSTARLVDLLGFRAEDFIPSVYELVPWSFLLDYFSNVGNVVEAGCASQEEVSWTLRTERLESIRVGAIALWNPFLGQDYPVYWQGVGSPGSYVISRSDVARGGASQLAVPSVEFSLPGSPLKWANIAALLQSNEASIRGRG